MGARTAATAGRTTARGVGAHRDPRGLRRAIAGRLRGPGGFYNIGNAIGLVTGLALQIAADAAARRDAGADADLAASLIAYFAASPGALALTIAMIVFFWSGETYHRAWSSGYPPDTRLNRRGDLLSAAGAAVLTVALVLAGQTALALVSGAMLFTGKLGSAIFPDNYSAGVRTGGVSLPGAFRTLVVASRAPAIAALAWVLAAHATGPGAALPDMIMTGVMLFCYFLWTWADLLLFARPRPAKEIRDA